MPNNYAFPVGYQPAQIYYPQNPYTPYPAYQAQAAQTAPYPNTVASPAQPQPAQMTPPTIHAEIVQIDGEGAIAQFPVNAGASQMMMAKDESFIAIKTMLANGQYTVVFYDQRPPAPPEPKINPDDYLTRAEFNARMSEMLAQAAPKKAAVKKEGEE